MYSVVKLVIYTITLTQNFSDAIQGCIVNLSDCYICNCLGERRWKRRPKSHFSSLLHQSAKWHRAVNMHCSYMSVFFTTYLILSVMVGKIKQYVCIKFCTKLGKSITKSLEVLHEVFEWHSWFKTGRVAVEDNKHSGWPSTSRTTESVEHFKNSSAKTTANQSMRLQIPLGSVMEFARS
jgi:hypothetical protein